MSSKRNSRHKHTDKEEVKTSPQLVETTKIKKDYTTAKERVELPSGFRPYPNDEITIRPFKIGEVKKISSIIAGASKVDILDIIDSVIEDMSAYDLTSGDFWFVLAWLRVNSFTNTPLKSLWTCPKCKKENTYVLDFTKVQYIELPKDYEEPAYLPMPSGKTLPLRLSRVGDRLIIDKYLKTMLNKDVIDDEDRFSARLAMCLANGQPLSENIKVIEGLSNDDLACLEAFNDEFAHGLPQTVEDKCSDDKCGYAGGRINLEFPLSDLIPTSEYRGYIRDAICFGEAPDKRH